ncbi:hypothetical protein [Mycobacterium sp. CnD-18-1]|uniref:hypothetical protein n=1 Tax=Mycobacterium sp. CnD-18-1 TaxID=2917744 RepID=UPI001EF1B842|nr:hypothetical protein [Mycobacterium sp. CnD-18-1]
MKHVDNGPPYPDEIVFVGVGAIYRLNQSWPHSTTIQVLDRTVGNMDYVGKHRLGKFWQTEMGTRYFFGSGNLRQNDGVGFGTPVGSVDRPLDIGDTWE